MSIAQVTDSSYMEKPQQNTLLYVLSDEGPDNPLTIPELDAKVNALNPDSEGYIGLKLLDITDLTDDEVIILKRLYITYRLYSQVEREEVVEDKKIELDELLDRKNEIQILRAQKEVSENGVQQKTSWGIGQSFQVVET